MKITFRLELPMHSLDRFSIRIVPGLKPQLKQLARTLLNNQPLTIQATPTQQTSVIHITQI